jgi:hypothetical protein
MRPAWQGYHVLGTDIAVICGPPTEVCGVIPRVGGTRGQPDDKRPNGEKNSRALLRGLES